jgi:hypothetical protein
MPARIRVAIWRVNVAISAFLTPPKIPPKSTSLPRPPFFAFASFACLPPFDSSKLVTSTPSLRRI